MSNKLTDTKKEEIRNLFVQGIEGDNGSRILYTIDNLADKFDVPRSTLYRHSQLENWKGQQTQFQHDYLVELDGKRKEELVGESQKFDTNSLNISKALLGQIGKAIQSAVAEERFTPQLCTTLAEATLKVQRVAKLALGESTENMNLNAKVQDSTAFREAMELLDEVGEQRRKVSDKAIH
tara:strand:- start:85 stop:624 length:540 start_codon:yes stop_codon:yes gene_type:complete